MSSKVKCKCKFCRDWFEARIADRKRGWAKCCSKSCAAKLRTRKQGNSYVHPIDRQLPDDDAELWAMVESDNPSGQ